MATPAGPAVPVVPAIDDTPPHQAGPNYLFLSAFLLAFLFRYLRTFVGIYTYATYRSTPIALNPKYRPNRDVSVVIPTTFKNPSELATCISNILRCKPAAVFVITSNANLAGLQSFCEGYGFQKAGVKCTGVAKLNKRKQILAALQDVRTDIVAFADDDVFWPSTSFLDSMLAVFEDPSIGAAGPRQRVRRSSAPNGWWFLGAAYLERRVWNNLTTQGIDGSISTLSGRTSLYRTAILRTDEFFHYFQTDSWLGKKLNSDDDKCLTRYVYSHGWGIKIQGDEAATIETTLEEDGKFLSQCLRWARARFRGNFTVMCNETYWYSARFLWGLYVIYVSLLTSVALVTDAILLSLLLLGLNQSVFALGLAVGLLCAWFLASKVLKMIPHFAKYPQDLKFVPLSIFFSYAHGVLNLYALATLHYTAWGSQNLGPGENQEDAYVRLRTHEEKAVEEPLIEVLEVDEKADECK